MNRAAAGETIAITRNGKPVAQLAPFTDRQDSPENAFSALLAMDGSLETSPRDLFRHGFPLATHQ